MIRPLITLFCFVLLFSPTAASAQVINGVAEWAFARGLFDSGAARTANSTFAQSYTLGHKGAIWDRRFLQYSADVTFRTNSLTFGGLSGKSNDLGFRIGISLFPARTFPLSVQVFRNRIGESGDFLSASVLRGGLISSPGSAAPGLVTKNSGWQVNWHLASPRLPRVEFGYRKGRSTVEGRGAEAEQHDSDVTANVYYETTRTRHTLRFLSNSTSNLFTQAFNQRLTDLAYEMTATPGKRSRWRMRAGRRSSYSLFDVAPSFTDIGAPTYRPASGGSSTVYYAEGSHTWEPVSRLSADVTVSADRDEGSLAATSAMLLSAGLSAKVFSGLTITGRGTYGTRGQTLTGESRSVRTANASGSVRYSKLIKFGQFSAGYTRYAGQNAVPGTPGGQTQGWSGSVNVGTAFSKGLNINGGYEKGRGTDPQLDFGNYDSDRYRVSIAGDLWSRILVQINWEDARIERGRNLASSRNRYQIGSGSLGFRMWRNSSINVTAGQFSNRSSDIDLDRTRYVGGTLDATFGSALVLSLNVRQESSLSARNRQEQHGLYSLAKAEYRLRLFAFGLEYRYSDITQSLFQMQGYSSRGNQILVRITRKFAF
jgi:hypothetical protein